MRSRILVGQLFLTVLLLAVLEIPFGINAADHERDELTTHLMKDAYALATFSEDLLETAADVQPIRRELNESLQETANAYETSTGARVVITDADGIAVADSDATSHTPRSFASRPEFVTALGGEVATGTRRSEDLDQNLLFVAVPVASGGRILGAVRLSFPTSELDRRVRETWWLLAAVGGVTLAAMTALGLVVARSVAKPLADLERHAVAFGAGDLARRSPDVRGPREVRSLATSFDDMATRLEELIGAQEQFVADASHQLRTPLTALRLQLENLEAEVDDAQKEDVTAAVAEVARMSRLVDGLLTLARAERSSGRIALAPVALSSLLDERRAMWAPLAAERGVTIAAKAIGDPVAHANADHLTQVLDNLIANALDVSAAGDTIWLDAATRPAADGAVDSTVEVHVRDQGPGMSASARTRAFERHWVGDDVPVGRQRLGGTGLGLAIVRKLVVAGGGAVELLEGPEGGLDVVVRLPTPSTRG